METFLVNEQILPRVYRSEGGDGVGFLITGLQHKIDQTGWTTTLKSQIYTTSAAGAPTKGRLVLEENIPVNDPQEVFDESTPNADALRESLKELGYTEKGRELSNGGDITPVMTRVSRRLFKQLKENFPTARLRVTGGNDRYHQNLRYNSKHKEGKGLDFVVDDPVNFVTPISTLITNFVVNIFIYK